MSYLCELYFNSGELIIYDCVNYIFNKKFNRLLSSSLLVKQVS